MKELKDSMDTIRLTAADFLEKLEAAVAERSAERVTAMQYAEKLIANREQEITIFDDEQRNLIVNFAFKLDALFAFFDITVELILPCVKPCHQYPHQMKTRWVKKKEGLHGS